MKDFEPLSSDELIKILGLTIKKDKENKLVTFLCQLSAYTENSQFNISFNAPSSTGKSYIPIEISYLFPNEDIIKLSACSPRAFYHEQGVYDKESNTMLVDVSRKIIIFMEQPNNYLLKEMRSLLSHDEKQITSKITDKNQKGGNRTKTVIIKGYPSVIFCSAGLRIDEQESTRFLLLSPETNQEKIRQSIFEKIKKETDNESYRKDIDNNPERKLLKERIEAIKKENILEIRIGSPEKLKDKFLNKERKLKPRDSRDIGRIISIIKSFALLNFWWRDRDGSTIIANDKDIKEAFNIWDKISESQELNLPPYIFNLHNEVIVPAYEERNDGKPGEDIIGLTRQELTKKHYEVYGRPINDWILRMNIIPMLENSNLIFQEPHPIDKRIKLIYPTIQHNINSEKNYSEKEVGVENNSVISGGVKEQSRVTMDDIPF